MTACKLDQDRAASVSIAPGGILFRYFYINISKYSLENHSTMIVCLCSSVFSVHTSDIVEKRLAEESCSLQARGLSSAACYRPARQCRNRERTKCYPRSHACMHPCIHQSFQKPSKRRRGTFHSHTPCEVQILFPWAFLPNRLLPTSLRV